MLTFDRLSKGFREAGAPNQQTLTPSGKKTASGEKFRRENFAGEILAL